MPIRSFVASCQAWIRYQVSSSSAIDDTTDLAFPAVPVPSGDTVRAGLPSGDKNRTYSPFDGGSHLPATIDVPVPERLSTLTQHRIIKSMSDIEISGLSAISSHWPELASNCRANGYNLPAADPTLLLSVRVLEPTASNALPLASLSGQFATTNGTASTRAMHYTANQETVSPPAAEIT